MITMLVMTVADIFYELLTISCDLACTLAQTIGAVLLIRDQGLPVLQGRGVVLIHDVQRCQWFASSYTFPFLR